MYNTLFPDEKFRNYLLNESYGKDGELTENEINDITHIVISDRNISSLAGIEYFTALELLWCYDNQLTALDVSNNTALTLLECYNNSIKGADMDALVGSLPQNTTSSSQLFIIVDISKDAPEGNVCTRAQAAVAKAKGWTVKAATTEGKAVRLLPILSFFSLLRFTSSTFCHAGHAGVALA
jgi:hypothetical protein